MLYGRYRYKNEQLHEKHRWDLTVETELWEKGRAGGRAMNIVHSHVSGTAVSQNPVTSASCVEQPAPRTLYTPHAHAPRPTPHNTYRQPWLNADAPQNWQLYVCVYIKKEKSIGEGGGGEEYNDR